MIYLPATCDLVLLGGGHAHALVLRSWAMNPLPGARLTLIDPNPAAPYTGMLPGLIAGHYARHELEIDLVRLARHAGARLITGSAEGLDLDAGRVHVPGRPPVSFDNLSIDIGITSDLANIPGFAEYGVAAKPLGAYAERWRGFLKAVDAGAVRPDVVVMGAGVGGVELALAMAFRLQHLPTRCVTLLERQQSILPEMGRAGQRLREHLRNTGVEMLTGVEVEAIEPDHVRLTSGRQIPAALSLSAAGSRPQSWVSGTGLHLTDGYVTVGPTLASVSHPAVYATGDCAYLAHAPRPKAGVFAVRAAPILAYNLRAALTGIRPRQFRPQRDYLKLISLGGRSALAEKYSIALEGRWLWRLKDRIDRRFMNRFHELPPMPAPAIPRPATRGLAAAMGKAPLCGGCGAKIGPDALRRTLRDLPSPRSDVRVGAGDDATVLEVGSVTQVLATDHLRAVTEDPWLMARIVAVHALGDIWAMGAAPQAALINVILPRLSEPLQERTLAEIMAGATELITEAGASVAGGHTSMGAELTIGFTVTGLVGKRLLTKAGAQPGDVLVLTKPIGSGTLLAAEMQKRARGRDIAALWPVLTQLQGRAAQMLAPVARAMTDITGFGLAGHLDEVLRASNVAADLDLATVPILAGAEDLAAEGIASTIAPANRAALLGRIEAPSNARAALLYDPQTAGGLLASIPTDKAESVTAALQEIGFNAAMIGRIRPSDGRPALRVI